MNLKIKSKFFSFLQLAGFILACALAAFAVIAPLWLFASKKPGLYSALVLAAIAAFFLYKIILWTKKKGIKKFLFAAAKITAAFGGAFAFIFFLTRCKRLLSLAFAVLAIAAFKALSLLEKKTNGKD